MQTQKPRDPLSTAFTAGGLLHEETLRVLPLIMHEDGEELLKQEALENQYILINAESARKRVLQEIRKRRTKAPQDYWEKFESANKIEQGLLLFYLCMMTYPVIYRLHHEVTMPLFKGSSGEVAHYHYEAALDRMSDESEKMKKMTHSVRTKVITVYLRMLREAGLMRDKTLQRPHEPAGFWSYFEHIGAAWFISACFLPSVIRIENGNR